MKLSQMQQPHAPWRRDAPRGVLLLDGRVLVDGVGVPRARLARPQEEQVQNGAQEQVFITVRLWATAGLYRTRSQNTLEIIYKAR